MEPFEQIINVRWSDLDPNGHVRHSAYYDYGAQARIAYLAQHGFDIAWMKRHGIGPMLFREEAHFYRELNSGDRLSIDLQLTGASADHRKWCMRHRILRGDELCAVLDLDGAWLDLKARKVATPPPDLLAAIEALARTEDFQVITSSQRT